MFSVNAAIVICREPWDIESGVRQRLYGYAAKGLVLRIEGTGRDIRFAARDLAVFRSLEAGRVNSERSDTELLTSISDALYARTAPDGTNGLGASIYWAARSLIDGTADPVVTAARLIVPGTADKPEWRARVHPADQPPTAPEGAEALAYFSIPLRRAFAPVLPYFDLGGDK